jgi:hypothetical protein
VFNIERDELELIRAEAVINFQTPTSTTLQGAIDWPDVNSVNGVSGLDLKEGQFIRA